MTPTIHAPRGLPAAGKSTLAHHLATRTGAVHVELDTHRHRIWPDCPPSWDPYHGRGLAVQRAFEEEITAHLAAGRDVIADRTNLAIEGLRRLERLGGRLVIHDLRHIPLTDCLNRDANRPASQRVGPDGIHALHQRWI